MEYMYSFQSNTCLAITGNITRDMTKYKYYQELGLKVELSSSKKNGFASMKAL